MCVSPVGLPPSTTEQEGRRPQHVGRSHFFHSSARLLIWCPAGLTLPKPAPARRMLIVVCRIVVFKPRPSRDGSGSSRNSVGHRLCWQRPAIEKGARAVAGRPCRGSRRPQDLHRYARAWREECDDLQHRAHRTGAPGSPRVTSRLTAILWPALRARPLNVEQNESMSGLGRARCAETGPRADVSPTPIPG